MLSDDGTTNGVLTIAQVVSQILLSDLPAGSAVSGQVLEWNGTGWAPATPASGTVSSVAGRTGAVTLTHSDISDWSSATAGLGGGAVSAVSAPLVLTSGTLTLSTVTPAPVSAVPTLATTYLLLADGTYLTGTQLQSLLAGTTVQALTLTAPTGVTAGSSYTIAGTLTGYSSAPTLTVSVDGGAFGTLPSGSTVTSSTISLLMPALSSGSHTVQVKDGSGNLSNIVTFTAASTTPALTLIGTVNNYSGLTVTASLSFVNGAPSGLTATLAGSALTISGVTITTTSGSGATAAGTASFTFTGPAVGTYSLVATGTGTYGSTSNALSVNITAAPVYTILVSTITAPAASTAFAVSGSYANATAAPTALDYSTNGGTTWTAASSPTISGGTSGTFSFSAAGLSAGTYTLKVRDHNSTSTIGTSNSFTVGAYTISVNTITAPAASTAFTVSGTYVNGTPAALDYSTNGGSTWTAASSPTISGGNYSFSAAGLAAGTYTVEVRDHTTTTVIGTSNSFTVPAYTITVNTITAPAASTAFTVSGTYSGGTPAALDYSTDGTTWTAASSPTISGGNYSFSDPGLVAGTYTLEVRDHTATTVIGTSNSFTITASSSFPTLTMTSPTYATGKFGQALSGGLGVMSLTAPAGSRTMECWFKSSTAPSAISSVLSDGSIWGFSIDTNGIPTVAIGFNQDIGSVSVCDGNWHHLAMVWDTTATSSGHTGVWTAFVDGVAGNSNWYGFNTPHANPEISIMAAGTYMAPFWTGSAYYAGGTSQTGFGTIDEVRISNNVRYPGQTTFTPPTAAFTPDANTIGLYHLDGNGLGG